MNASPSRPPLWFWIGIGCVWAFALAFRFWGLERFNTFVFDEVYFAKFAHHYLTQTAVFDAHPPLGKYLIALGIALKGFNTWGFRWVNALIGATIPLILAGIAYQLSKRHSYALITAVIASLDGLLLVESRYALLNVHILFFGLLAHWLMLMALSHKDSQRKMWLAGAGVSFGATIAVKWNGLGFLLGFYLLWFVVKFGRIGLGTAEPQKRRLPIQRLAELSWQQMFVYLPAIAGLIYSICWIPHLVQNPDFNFWQVHQQIFSYHQRVGGDEVHPFCSSWYTWPLLLKPISYLYQVTQSTLEPLPVTGPPLPEGSAQWIYSVYATGNPLLWWASSIAIFVLLGWGGLQIAPRLGGGDRSSPSLSAEQVWIPGYIGVNYLANFLPWAGVSRCTFLYHYMPASMFSSLALAWIIEGWLHAPDKQMPRLAGMLLLLSLLSFMLCLPLFLGLPLSPIQWNLLRGRWL